VALAGVGVDETASPGGAVTGDVDLLLLALERDAEEELAQLASSA